MLKDHAQSYNHKFSWSFVFSNSIVREEIFLSSSIAIFLTKAIIMKETITRVKHMYSFKMSSYDMRAFRNKDKAVRSPVQFCIKSDFKK
jgi:hypothetical protein